MRRLYPGVEIVRVHDVGLEGADDVDILAWAAGHERLVVSHDVRTLRPLAEARVATGQRMPGLVEASQRLAIGSLIEDLAPIGLCLNPGEWEGLVVFLPLSR